MSKINNAIHEIYEMDELVLKNSSIHQLHPLVKLVVTLFYIVCVVSFDKYNLFGLLPMILYPILVFNLAELNIRKCFIKFRFVLPVICFMAIFNPMIDHTPLINISGVLITGGMVSMITLVIKGTLALMASFLLIASTGIEGICYALKLMGIPNIIVTQILLAYRYITLLMQEANTVSEAYSLRAPKEKGVKYKVWGSLIGQLMFRSIDRATSLYESMILRGFHGTYYFRANQRLTHRDYIYLAIWVCILGVLKFYQILNIVLLFIQHHAWFSL